MIIAVSLLAMVAPARADLTSKVLLSFIGARITLDTIKSPAADTVVIKPGMHISAEQLKAARLSTHFDEKRKIVVYLDEFVKEGPYIVAPLSAEACACYEKNNITVVQNNCGLGKAPEVQEYSTKKIIKNVKNHQYHVTRKYCTLISDANKNIDIYVSKMFGCDARYYVTSHPTRIAILIDETGYIVGILDDVQNEYDVLKAFGMYFV